MKVSAVISEFNPMHKGHKYLFECARENGATNIIAVMSGNYVQRGDCAIFSKWDRALDAVKNGVDLVVEIPSVKSCSSASNFADAGVTIAEKCGCVDELFFGSECNDIEAIKRIVDILDTDEYKSEFEAIYSTGISYPAARKLAIQKINDSAIADVLDNPNDILAIEYVRSLKKNHSKIDPVCFGRIGQSHDSFIDGDYPSAGMIREKILNGSICAAHPVHSLKNAERMMLYKLRELSSAQLKNVPDVDEGLESRIKQCVNEYDSIDEILDNLKTKRYTYSRLRRILLSALLNIERDDVYSPVSYIKVLAFNDRGREVLKIMRDTAKLPVIMKYSDIYKTLDEKLIKDYEKEVFCSDVYALMADRIEQCGQEQKNNAIYLC